MGAGAMIALEGVKSIPSFIVAANQARQLSSLKKQWEGKFPTYEIPDSQKQALAAARFRAYTSGLPGQAQFENKLQRQQAASLNRSMQSQGSAIERSIAAAAGDYSTKSALEESAMKAAQMKNSNVSSLMEAYNRYSGFEDKQYKINKFDPYMAAAKTMGALRQSQWENLSKGINALAGAGQSYLYATNPDLASTMKSAGESGDAGGGTSWNSPAPDLSFPSEPTASLQFPADVVGGFNNAYYGMEIPLATQQKYGMYDGMNRFMNQVYANPLDYTG